MFSGTDSPFLMLSAVFHLPLLPVLHLPVNSLSGRELSCSHRTVWLSVVLFFCGNGEGRYSFRLEAGRNTTKVARDACISFSHRRMAPLEATKCY